MCHIPCDNSRSKERYVFHTVGLGGFGAEDGIYTLRQLQIYWIPLWGVVRGNGARSWLERTFRSVIDTLILSHFRSHAPRMPHVEFLFRRRFVECYGIDVGGEGEDVGDGDGVEGEVLVGEQGSHYSVFSRLGFWGDV